MASITIANGIKQEIAKKVVEISHPGYSIDAQGSWYVVDGSSVMHAQANRPWNPWHDNADVISVEDLVVLFGGAEDCDFDPSPSDDVTEDDAYEAAVGFALGYVPDSYDTADMPVNDY